MKLEVGMYVRLVNDVEDIVVINKIANVFETTILTENDGSNYQGEYTKENVVKASYNIIDLIEVGDYVNGEKVLRTNCKLEYVDDDSETGVNEVDNGLELETGWIYFEHEVQSIVTKEQFESIEYRIGE